MTDLSLRQRVVLGEIVFGKYQSERRDGATLRALLRRGLIREVRDEGDTIQLPAAYVATADGRKAMVMK